MGRRGHRAGWGGRADHFAVSGARLRNFDTDFKINLTVPVHRDMPTCSCDLLLADDGPHGAARLWYDTGQFPLARAPAHDGKRLTRVLFESDDVLHAKLPFAARCSA